MQKNNQKLPTLYLDISEFLSTRITTGIQRVICEFLRRAIKDNIEINIIYFDASLKAFKQLPNDEIDNFLKDIKNYKFILIHKIDLFAQTQEEKIFFDMDSIWNNPLKREDLYPKLKKSNYKIYNFIYDLIPVLFPNYFYEKTKTNFYPFLNAVFHYSDMVFLDSISSKNDFLELQNKAGFKREILNDVIYLGSDFASKSDAISNQYTKLLSTKYILFVGTIEPRKCQLSVLEAFEELHKTYPTLNLVFIGRVGWKMEDFMAHLQNHSLINKNIHHLQNIDDNTLSYFYKQAFLVTYLSKYEGYGLPVAESLSYGNITIVSKNSSLTEVGQEFVDYIDESKSDELTKLISNYIEDKNLYNQRKTQIQTTYKPISWDDMYETLLHSMARKYVFNQNLIN